MSGYKTLVRLNSPDIGKMWDNAGNMTLRELQSLDSDSSTYESDHFESKLKEFLLKSDLEDW